MDRVYEEYKNKGWWLTLGHCGVCQHGAAAIDIENALPFQRLMKMLIGLCAGVVYLEG